MRTIAMKLRSFGLFLAASMAIGCSSGGDAPASSTVEAPAPAPPETGVAKETPSAQTEDAPHTYSLIHGTLTDEGAGDIHAHLAGAGTLANATKVQIVKVSAGGKAEVAATAEIDASGSFSVKVDPTDFILVAQAMGKDGLVLGSAIIGSVQAGIDAVAAPITTETSLRAELLLRLAASADIQVGYVVPWSVATIHAFVDTSFAAAISSSIKAGADVEAVLAASASALLTAQATLSAALLSAKADLNASLIATAQLALIASFNASLKAGVAMDVAGSIVASLQASTGLALDVVANAIISANAAFQSAIQVKLDAAIKLSAEASATASAAVFAALHAGAAFEAAVLANVTELLAREHGAAEAALAATIRAGATLVANVQAALDVNAILNAKVEFRASVSASLDLQLDVGAAVTGAFRGVADVLAQVQASLPKPVLPPMPVLPPLALPQACVRVGPFGGCTP